jgi:transcriptional regulator with XRE-family HTH domain
MHKKPRSNKIDSLIGEKLRFFRLLKNLSQQDIAKKAGVTFQQIQKYESGTNRISASRLYNLAKILEINLLDFFEDIESQERISQAPFDFSLLNDEAFISFFREWKKIKNDKFKESIRKVVQTYIT